MAENKQPSSDEVRSSLAAEFGDEGEEDFLFRSQMKIYDLFMGGWKQLLVIGGVFLLVVLVYGLWESHHRDTQRTGQSQIAKVLRDMPEPDPRFFWGLAPMDNPNDSLRMGSLKKAAQDLEGVGQDAQGASAVMAYLEAADAWKRAGEFDKQIDSLQKATELSSDGLLNWTVLAALATAHAEKGDHEKSASLYRQFIDERSNEPGFLSSQALFNLALIQADAGDKEKSKSAIDELMKQYPESSFQEAAGELLLRLGEEEG